MSDDLIFSIVERAVSSETLTGQRCFACGENPTAGQGEHVIPRWLQRRFNLSNKRLELINQTFLPYRSLTVPCCTACNNGFLREIENAVIALLDGNTIEKDDSRITLARWLCKIFIGVLVKETSLPHDRKSPAEGSIVPPELLEDFRHAQLILQSARKPTSFISLHGRYPFTVYLYNIYPDPAFGQFDVSTNILGQSIAIRLGSVGAVFVNDGGLQLVAGDRGPFGLDGQELHPLQFSELAARVHYKAALRDATHSYVSAETADLLSIRQESVQPFTSILVEGGACRIFRPWNEAEFADVLRKYVPIDWGPIQNPAEGTFLVDVDGERIRPESLVRD